MIFNSLTFLVFITAFFLVYPSLRGRWRLYFILFGSYVFYAWWDYRYLSLILLSTFVDYYAGKKIARSQSKPVRLKFLQISILTNLGLLFIFKYFNFFSQSLHSAFAAIGFTLSPLTLNVLLPVGISFYTFQTLSYTIDIYRGKIEHENDFVTFATFVAFFPQLVAGPIERASRLIPQIKKLSGPTPLQIREGFSLVLLGYFQKVFIADNLSRVVDYMFAYDTQRITTGEILIGVLAFALQIYGDFAGYSKIARGISKFFGIELMRNFRQPYFAPNPAEFWRRWHISLSTWLRDYLYIPLGGNRHGEQKMFRNLFLTMTLGGLWHGASWTFVIWGLYQGLLLILYRCYTLLRKPDAGRNIIKKALSVFGTFVLTLYGWLIFRSNDLSQLKQFTLKLLGPLQLPDDSTRAFFFSIIPFWLILFYLINLVIDGVQEHRQTDILFDFSKWWDYIFAAVIIFLILMFGGRSDAFIYFQF